MRRLLLFFIIVLGFASCKNEPHVQIQNEIMQLELVVKEDAEQEDIETLLETYQSYISDYSSDSNSPVYLVRAAELLSRINRPQSAIELLEKGYREYYNSLHNSTNGLFLGNILREKSQNELLAQIVYKSTLEMYPNANEIKKKIIDSTLSVPQLLDNISELIFNENTGKIDFLQANNYIEGSVFFTMLQPDNKLAPEYLFKASEASRAIQKYSRTIDLYEWLISDYMDYNKIGQVHFLYAFTLDNDLGRIEEAKIAYNNFIEKFPNSDFIDDAKFLIENLGKSEEEIIESFNR
jgi:tetratricopeptide (TPR) repeat protein